ncbi:ABC transporter permease [Corynebacterium glutamicum]|uniref:ABC transporter permease n=1 Tax=Corynebacterium glutamicum TaxID=1718 RepID=UPI0005C5EC5D|nr:ABC transporter permease [Corynebacterium glutamicum]
MSENDQNQKLDTDQKTGQPKIVTIVVDDSDLAPLDGKPRLGQYCANLWRSRSFIRTHALTKVHKNSRDRYLGNLWVILDPIFQVSIYALIFGLILKVDRGMSNFVGFLVIGVVFFGIFSSGITGGSNLIQNSRSLITSFTFPRIAVVTSGIVKLFLDNLVPCLLAVIIAIAFQWGEPIHWSVIFVIPLYLLAHLFAFGTTAIIARITAFIPDFRSVVTLLSRGLFFLSGVFFEISRFDASPLLQSIVESNPIYQFLKAFRSCIIDGSIPGISSWVFLTVWSVSIATFGFIFFYLAEERYSVVK